MREIEKWAGEALLHHNTEPGAAVAELLRCLRADGNYPQTLRALDALVKERDDLRDRLQDARDELDEKGNEW